MRPDYDYFINLYARYQETKKRISKIREDYVYVSSLRDLTRRTKRVASLARNLENRLDRINGDLDSIERNYKRN